MEANLSIYGVIIEARKVKALKNETGDYSEVWNYVIQQNDYGREDTCLPFTAYNPIKKGWGPYLQVGKEIRVDLCVSGIKRNNYWYVTAKCVRVWADTLENEYRHRSHRRSTIYDDVTIDVIRNEDGNSPRPEDLIDNNNNS